jgi:ribosomal protein S18 acetylase RimI-like enzyme
MNLDTIYVKEIHNQYLSNWSIYDPTKLTLGYYQKDILCISYKTSQKWRDRGTTNFSVNIIENVYYILFIELHPDFKHQGLGSKLYSLLTDIAKELGCTRIEQTPSGQTDRGESRDLYLKRRGWDIDYTQSIVPIATKVFK